MWITDQFKIWYWLIIARSVNSFNLFHHIIHSRRTFAPALELVTLFRALFYRLKYGIINRVLNIALSTYICNDFTCCSLFGNMLFRLYINKRQHRGICKARHSMPASKAAKRIPILCIIFENNIVLYNVGTHFREFSSLIRCGALHSTFCIGAGL